MNARRKKKTILPAKIILAASLVGMKAAIKRGWRGRSKFGGSVEIKSGESFLKESHICCMDSRAGRFLIKAE